jgi:hypothetical protein
MAPKAVTQKPGGKDIRAFFAKPAATPSQQATVSFSSPLLQVVSSINIFSELELDTTRSKV